MEGVKSRTYTTLNDYDTLGFMARPLRIEYPHAWYHVMNRGAARRKIFKNDTQREYFLSLLGDTSRRFNADWHVYCLMDNHYHLMVHTPEGNLQRIMRHVNGVYTQFFNRQERRDGPLFRGRYKAILVDAECYWLELSRYIHRNPLAAGIAKDLRRYRWSSYRAYVGIDQAPDWLTTKYILWSIGRTKRQRRYAKFVGRRPDPYIVKFYEGSIVSPILGDQNFTEHALEGRADTPDIPELKTARTLPAIDEIIDTVSRFYHIERETIITPVSGSSGAHAGRFIAMELCRKVGDHRLRAIAEAFGYASANSASRGCRLGAMRIAEDEGMSSDLDVLMRDLTP